MKKSYKIEVDCANCANKMEDAAKRRVGGGPGAKGCQAGSFQKLQKGRKRLRKLSVNPKTKRAGWRFSLEQHMNSCSYVFQKREGDAL